MTTEIERLAEEAVQAELQNWRVVSVWYEPDRLLWQVQCVQERGESRWSGTNPQFGTLSSTYYETPERALAEMNRCARAVAAVKLSMKED